MATMLSQPPEPPSDLYFFDTGYPREKGKRIRKPTESLPEVLREVRSSASFLGAVKLESFYQKKAFESIGDHKESRKKVDIRTSDSESPTSPVKDKAGGKLSNLRTDSSKDFLEQGCDSQRIYFEDAKFSATTVLSQLGKVLHQVTEIREEENQAKDNLTEEVVEETLAIDYASTPTSLFRELSRQFIQREDGTESLAESVYPTYANRILTQRVIDLLKQDYEDLIAKATYHKRLWQTKSYQDIARFSNKKNGVIPNDSGIFSKPATAMSFVYPKSAESRPAIKKKSKKGSESKINLPQPAQEKISKDSGLNSDSAAETANKKTSKEKTRMEKYWNQPGKDKKISEEPANEENEKEKMKDKVEKMQSSQPVISFSVSSKACRDRGWVVDPSASDDPEYHTLIEWATKRLQVVIKETNDWNKKNALQDMNQEVTHHFYGDTRREITMKYKKGTKLAKLLEKEKEQGKRSHLFRMTLHDGGNMIIYPSGALCVISVRSSATKPYGFYTFVYADYDQDCRLLAYFTSSGKGVCYSSAGTIGFISTDKFAAFHSEDGTMTEKHKWPPFVFKPMLQYTLSSQLFIKCANMNDITLHVKIDGETSKIKIGSSEGIRAPKLDNMGPLLTKERFGSQIAIELSKLNVKKVKKKTKKEEERERSQESLAEAAEEARKEELDLQFPERKQFELFNPYQIELRNLQLKFKSTITSWMDFYRIATGITSPSRVSAAGFNLRKEKLKSAPYRSTPRQLSAVVRNRVPSAPPIRRNTFSLGTLPEHYMPPGTETAASESNRAEASTYGEPQSPLASPRSSRARSTMSPGTSQQEMEREPFKCGLLRPDTKPILQKDGCPIAIRSDVQGRCETQCRCDKRHIPIISDVEFEAFLRAVPKTQLIVVQIVLEGASPQPIDEMLDEIYFEQNKNRTFPCVQARNDSFRLTRYQLQATYTSRTDVPLLLERHNVLPGMFLMYHNGQLAFADFILDGYGTTKKDLMKQVNRTRRNVLKNHYLPSDFRFAGAKQGSGEAVSPRAPWGGESGESNVQTISYNLSQMMLIQDPSVSSTQPLDVDISKIQFSQFDDSRSSSRSSNIRRSSVSSRPAPLERSNSIVSKTNLTAREHTPSRTHAPKVSMPPRLGGKRGSLK